MMGKNESDWSIFPGLHTLSYYNNELFSVFVLKVLNTRSRAFYKDLTQKKNNKELRIATSSSFFFVCLTVCTSSYYNSDIKH